MNVSMERCLPPVLVIGAALYFGWDSNQSSLNSEDVVRAASVRWRPDDLLAPEKPAVARNPFDSVLVVSDTHEVEEETGKLIPASRPAGPRESELRTGLAVSGIATMAGRNWAIVNGRPRLPGDVMKTNDNSRHECELVSIAHDHVVVRCQETVAKVPIKPNGNHTAQANSGEAVGSGPVEDLRDAPERIDNTHPDAPEPVPPGQLETATFTSLIQQLIFLQ